MILYQLVAYGEYACLEGRGKFHSKKVFASKEAADAHIEDFKKSCCTQVDKYDMGYFSCVHDVKIVRLELEVK